MKHMHVNSSGNIRTCKWYQPRITNSSEGAHIHIKKQKQKGEKGGRPELEIVSTDSVN